jgi:hypothetical protein
VEAACPFAYALFLALRRETFVVSCAHMTTPTSQRDPALEQRTSELQLQIEQVSVALQQLRQTHDTLQQMESRLGEMTTECAGILDRWAKNDERHASAVAELHGRLSEWNDLERKLLSESASRIYQFERGVQHEWHALRQKHEEPLQKLDAQASRIAESCLTAVDAALRGFDRAETRLIALEQQVQRQIEDVTREMREAIAELRQPGLQLTGARPWPLEDVVRLHSELRAEANATDDSHALLEASGAPPSSASPPDQSTQVKFAGSAQVKMTPPPTFGTTDAAPQPAATDGASASTENRRTWIVSGAIVAAVLVGSLVYLWRQVDTGLSAATSRAAAAERGAEEARRQATDQIAAIQRTAEERIASAQQAAFSAQLTANVLAAPDLYRLDLGGAPTTSSRANAQVLWSRSRGIVFSGSRLPSAPANHEYHLWLVTPQGPFDVGPVRPDQSGRASIGFDPPSGLPRPVVGAVVTLEPRGGSPRPTGTPVLSTPTVPAAPPTS